MERLRRVTYWSLAAGVVLAWLGPATWLLARTDSELLARPESEPLALVQLALLGVALPIYTVVYLRAVRLVVLGADRRREIAICGLLALLISVVTAGTSWPSDLIVMRAGQVGMVVASWAGLAALGASRLSAALLCVGTVGVGVLLTPLEYWPGAVVPLTLMCVFATWANRFQLWIWELLKAVERGREAQTRLAVTEERLRFSRDLHDVVGHSLSAIAVKSELAARLATLQPERAEAEMREVRQLAREALREIRAVVRGYRTVDLDSELRSVRAVLNAAEIRTELELPGTRLPDEVSTVIAWLVREGTTNVLRHSTASWCRIAVTIGESGVELEMRNDGVASGRTTSTTRSDHMPEGGNLDEERARGRGSGIAGMTERVTALGGTLSAGPGSRADEYVLRATIPLPHDSLAPRDSLAPHDPTAPRDLTVPHEPDTLRDSEATTDDPAGRAHHEPTLSIPVAAPKAAETTSRDAARVDAPGEPA
ncbi:two-component system sensor histidine kinase DesK [Thermasporomyces composti]|jgi:two-component system sensor histidine kinase DesK|uniref:Two-component system sensor histidine kinase DesK n=2 Tax=Thermasporomyces composti TaxID=696763 RepID=A0A3D9V5T6_THECX|nr:two-component system sensor histidine kinase DesK [Thermasporomyces composti]